ncbi:MAG TPA: D-alanyl-D-alanine carboxypeptidase/D-alanyl-D-alanine-endopeptidase [Pyrinomonadaceae bacterium]|nr:D-alanyl-D-alanine carboxypeptidase/D-alanyl-D-alanine-endopeptidase [Pyrinomonadaceae bacterium]
MNSTPERRRALVSGGASVAVLLALALALPAYVLRSHSRESGAGAAIDEEPFESARQSPPRAGGVTRARDEELGRRIGELIEKSEAASARWGVHVVSLRDARVLYERDARRLFAPASNMKLYTTAVALELLGAGHRWRTSVYAAAGADAAGTIKGDLVLYGRGAPDLSSRAAPGRGSQLSELADKLYARGVRRVRGDVVGDESFFRGEALGAGWLWEDVQWYYGAEPSALSIDDNEVALAVAPGKEVGAAAEVESLPALEQIRVTNELQTIERGARGSMGITRELSSNAVRVWGELPAGGSSYKVRLSVRRPALVAASLFRDALGARGIEVAGTARVVDARTPLGARLDTAGAVELASVTSATLGEVVRETNKKSLNLQAELLLRTLGRERGDTAPDPDPERMRRRDTDAAGLAVVRCWLESAAGAEPGALDLRDGSGLSRLNRVTPEATTRLLGRMSRSPSAALFRASLPVAGRDGTLERRLRRSNAAGRVAAKTGSFTHVGALSGYALTADGEPLAFSVICNDDTGGSSERVIDSIVTLLSAYPDAEKAVSRK